MKLTFVHAIVAAIFVIVGYAAGYIMTNSAANRCVESWGTSSVCSFNIVSTPLLFLTQ